MDRYMIEFEEPRNLEEAIEIIESRKEKVVHNTFLDLQEPEILGESDYKQMQYKKYAYAVNTLDDKF